jgi:hypothetical protein
MTLAIILVVAAAVALGIILGLAAKRGLEAKADAGLAASIRPLDLEAFRNLINSAEDDYLRRHLPAARFRAVRRARLLAMAAYVRAAGRNAAVLVRVGEAARASTDARVADAAHQLVNQALLLRRNTTVALARIYIAMAWPNSSLGTLGVVDGYKQVSDSAMLLGRLQNPATTVRLSANPR